MNTRAAPRFLLQPMQYSPVCGHTGSQCFDEGDRSNWADRWFHGTRVGHTGPGYPSTRVLTSLIQCDLFDCYIFNYEIMPSTLANIFLFILQGSAVADLRYGGRF